MNRLRGILCAAPLTLAVVGAATAEEAERPPSFQIEVRPAEPGAAVEVERLILPWDQGLRVTTVTTPVHLTITASPFLAIFSSMQGEILVEQFEVTKGGLMLIGSATGLTVVVGTDLIEGLPSFVSALHWDSMKLSEPQIQVSERRSHPN